MPHAAHANVRVLPLYPQQGFDVTGCSKVYGSKVGGSKVGGSKAVVLTSGDGGKRALKMRKYQR